jgi:hypothetical protein
MKDWYFSFVINSNPNKQSWLGKSAGVKPNWPVYGAMNQTLIVKGPDENPNIVTATDIDVGPKCDFWRNRDAITRN